jgi:PRTRC genetic system protein B
VGATGAATSLVQGCQADRLGFCRAHPDQLFAARHQKWFVFAVRGGERPGPVTPLCNEPYFNVWESDGICAGNVELPEQPGPEAIAAYESAFIRSPNHGCR